MPLPSALHTVGVLGLSPVAEADRELGQRVVRKGNTIEVLGPGPSVDRVAIVDAASDNRYLELGPEAQSSSNVYVDQ